MLLEARRAEPNLSGTSAKLEKRSDARIPRTLARRSCGPGDGSPSAYLTFDPPGGKLGFFG
jgi:hypothetical protein